MKLKSLLLPLIAGLASFAFTFNLAAAPAKNNALSFIENKGQIVDQYQQPRADIDVKLQAGDGLSIFIGTGKIAYQWAKPIEQLPTTPLFPNGPTQQTSDAYELYRLDVALLGANPQAQHILEEQQTYFERYYLSWVNTTNSNTGIQAFAYKKLTYKNIYPNIDWVFYFNEEGLLEHDFIVHPGGKVSDIQIKYGGTTTLELQQKGDLTATTPMGSITESAPYCIQDNGNIITSNFVLQDDVVSFHIDNYRGTLTIDPTLEWGTYYGGSYSDNPAAIVADDNNYVYLAGITASTANIATVGAYQTTYGGPGSTFVLGDAFVSKFSTSGELIWATYYGGSDVDRCSDLALDQSSNKLYLAGSTKSISAITTSSAHQTSHGGAWDAFLVQFDTAGERQWGTYYGGSNDEGVQFYTIGVATDTSGAVILSGESNSLNNIASQGVQQELNNGSKDGFVVKFDSTGVRQWSTYFGGGNDDYAKRVATDSDNNIYITGYTNSNTGISTSSAYQPNNNGEFDAFLVKYDSYGVLQWATYYGASGHDEGHALCIDHQGTIFIAGLSLSPTGVGTVGAHQELFGGSLDGFLAKFSSNGALEWGSYYGGSGIDLVTSIVTSISGELFISGYTTSDTGIASIGGFVDTLCNQSYDVFFSKFSGNGIRQWGSYFGGTGGETNCFTTVNSNGELFLTGLTNSAAGIATANSYQPQLGGGSDDVFLIKLNVCEQPPTPLTLTGDTLICEGRNYIYTADSVDGAIAYEWLLPPGWLGSSDTNSITVTPGANSGSIAVVALNNCAASNTLSMDITVNPAPVPVIQQEENVLSTTESYSTYQWIRDGADIAGATAATYTVTDTGMYAVRVINEEGCSGTSEAVAAGGTGIDELAALGRSVSLYPNPVSSLLYIKSPIAVTVVVSGIEGKQLLVAAQATTIDLSNLVPGMYLLQVYDSEGRLLKTEKVVKGAK